MAFPPKYLDELRARIPVSEVIAPKVRLTRRGREAIGLCPFHNEKTPSFIANDDKAFYHCFGCGAHGDIITFVMETEGLSFPDAVEKLARKAGVNSLIVESPLQNQPDAKGLSNETLLQSAEKLQEILILSATGGSADGADYKALRTELIQADISGPYVPSFVRNCRDLFQFWEFIKYELGTYAERRKFIWEGFRPLFELLETSSGSPSDSVASITLKKFDVEHVHQVWQRAIDRRSRDPEGAITISRTLLESVCKHILDAEAVSYSDNADLTKLYKLTAETLNLAPSQHTEEAFKAILGACQTIVNYLGTLRNRISDAHGKGRKPVRPKIKHAELAVNLAGSMATFLVSTWQEKKISRITDEESLT
jgi:hypothetical protein